MRRVATVRTTAGAVAALIMTFALGGCAAGRVVHNSGFEQTLRSRCLIERCKLAEVDGHLSVTLVGSEEVTAGAFREALDWIRLYFAESQEPYFRELKEAFASGESWERYRVIEVAAYVGRQEAFDWKLDENEAAVPGGRGIRASEVTDAILEQRVLEPNDLKEFEAVVRDARPEVSRVVLERLFLSPTYIAVSFVSDQPLSEEAMAETRRLVVTDLLQRPWFVGERPVLVLVDYYAGERRQAQYAWDNLRCEWFDEPWSERVFRSVAPLDTALAREVEARESELFKVRPVLGAPRWFVFRLEELTSGVWLVGLEDGHIEHYAVLSVSPDGERMEVLWEQPAPEVGSAEGSPVAGGEALGHSCSPGGVFDWFYDAPRQAGAEIIDQALSRNSAGMTPDLREIPPSAP